MLEGVNDQASNQVTLHTASTCTMPSAGRGQTGRVHLLSASFTGNSDYEHMTGSERHLVRIVRCSTTMILAAVWRSATAATGRLSIPTAVGGMLLSAPTPLSTCGSGKEPMILCLPMFWAALVLLTPITGVRLLQISLTPVAVFAPSLIPTTSSST
jgi:hypothetical protein